MEVSTLLLTFNEEQNLPRCLEALHWCNDIVAIDSGSTDRTVEILKAFGARVIYRSFDNFAQQRNFGLEAVALRNEWVLHLDADEVVTPAFVAALEALRPSETIDGYFVPSKAILFDRWLKHAGMWPSYQARIGHSLRMRFKQVGHGQREDVPAERMGIFDEPYLHFNFSHGMKRWLEKHVRYALDEATQLVADREEGLSTPIEASSSTARRRRLKHLARRIPLFLRPISRFFYVYILRQGFRDGHAGLAYAVMLSVYEGMIAVFVYEKTLANKMKTPCFVSGK